MAETIQSRSNARFKRWKKLLTTRGRAKENGFLVESGKLAADFLCSGRRAEALITSAGRLGEARERILSCGARFSEKTLREALERLPAFELPDAMFRELCESRTPDGVLVAGKGSLIDDSASLLEAGRRVLLLDAMQDPGNLGAVLRSAEAFGFFTVILCDSVDPGNPKALRASMGAAFRLRLISLSAESAAGKLKEMGYRFVGADMTGIDYRRYVWSDRAVLAIGNEGNGLGREVRGRIDDFVSIPMKGQAESLNAAVSAAVLMASADVGE